MIVKEGEVTYEKVLLVEGKTPCHLFEALAKEMKIDKTIEIRDFGGIQRPRAIP